MRRAGFGEGGSVFFAPMAPSVRLDLSALLTAVIEAQLSTKSLPRVTAFAALRTALTKHSATAFASSGRSFAAAAQEAIEQLAPSSAAMEQKRQQIASEEDAKSHLLLATVVSRLEGHSLSLVTSAAGAAEAAEAALAAAAVADRSAMDVWRENRNFGVGVRKLRRVFDADGVTKAHLLEFSILVGAVTDTCRNAAETFDASARAFEAAVSAARGFQTAANIRFRGYRHGINVSDFVAPALNAAGAAQTASEALTACYIAFAGAGDALHEAIAASHERMSEEPR